MQWGPNRVEPDSTVRIWISRPFLEGQQLEHVAPEPQSVEVAADRMIFAFKVNDPAQPGWANFSLKTNQIGRAEARVGLERGPVVEFWQFVYP